MRVCREPKNTTDYPSWEICSDLGCWIPPLLTPITKCTWTPQRDGPLAGLWGRSHADREGAGLYPNLPGRLGGRLGG